MLIHIAEIGGGMYVHLVISPQMKHVSTQTNRMVDVAVTTVKAAEVEEAMGSGEDSEASHDPELQVSTAAIKELV